MFLTSGLLTGAGFRHAFFTRRGGVSRAPWGTLNFAASTGDDPAAVAENLARAARALGVAPERVYFLSQVHGCDVKVLWGDERRDEVIRAIGDVTASAAPGVACGVRTADCVPVLVGDPRSGAVTAIHSGWRGTVSNVVASGVAALRALAGPGAELVAAVGPHIERCCFEVGEDVALDLARCSAAGEAPVLEGPAVEAGAPPKKRVDLRRIVRAQLEALGVGAIDDVRGCTYCDAERFHSFRRDGQRSGRLLSAIVAGTP